MANPWTSPHAPPVLGRPGGVVTLLEGAEFCVSDRAGDITPGTPHGLFFLDTRFVSCWELRVDGAPLEPLDVVAEEPYTALHVLRAVPRHGRADTPLVVLRERWLGQGMREDITVVNYGTEPAHITVELSVAADFADLFEVKERRVRPQGEYAQAFRDGVFSHRVRRDGMQRALAIRFSEVPGAGPMIATWEASVEPQERWRLCAEASFALDEVAVEPRFRCGEPIDRATSAGRLEAWRAHTPNVRSDHEPLAMAAGQAIDDLGVLRIADPEYPDREIIAAGAPWFMTLFGRDSLLTAWMALLVDLDLARGVLHTLARFQGSEVNPGTEEEPGRILHEMRFGEAASLALGGGSIYYGTVDATPLFVMLVGELRRWGLAEEDTAALLPHVDRALAWIERFGDRDGDGYVEYQRASERGLRHQGWKDSWDGTRFADGRFAPTPVALCEVQAYTYGAYISRAHSAEQVGDETTAARCVRRAAELKARFNEDFWLEDRGWLAMGLDADKRPIDALTSNMGHCLWTGILDEEKAAVVADRLLASELFTGWGIRTAATSMRAYNPTSYHNGSVWPHDTAICIAGLMRYGFVEHAQRVALGLLDVAATGGGRLPELFCGFAREEVPAPVGYPTSCSPQAWAAAAPLLLVRTLLRFDPWVPRGKLWLDPALPPQIRRLHVERIPLGGSRVSIDVEDDTVAVEGLPPGVELLREARRPISAYLSTAPR